MAAEVARGRSRVHVEARGPEGSKDVLDHRGCFVQSALVVMLPGSPCYAQILI